ncbi:MAG: helix-hairpin-helix domain-containing protein, partial [Candidatus Thermoplasmatota archaeon]|nr:helix-hairpin-helix domain-containing protein [Candidatus Thermoplasmatota archaeon]
MSEESTINQFTSLKGVGKVKAKLLYDNGFTSLEKLKGASLEKLTKIEGINETLAKGIIDQTNSTGKTEKAEKPKQEKKSEGKTEEKAVQKTETKEEVQIVEEKEDEHKVKKKPELDSQLKGSLQKR